MSIENISILGRTLSRTVGEPNALSFHFQATCFPEVDERSFLLHLAIGPDDPLLQQITHQAICSQSKYWGVPKEQVSFRNWKTNNVPIDLTILRAG